LIQWVVGEVPTPAEFDIPLFARICAYRQSEEQC